MDKSKIKLGYKLLNSFIERYPRLSDMAMDELEVIIQLLEEGECDDKLC
jgi:hypothetical protein